MKPHSPARRLSRIFHGVMVLALLAPNSPAFAADGDMATTTLNGMTGALNGVNGLFNAFGTSSLDLQQLAQKLQGSQQQMGNVQTQQSQFDQIQTQLTNAMTEAQNCVQKATRTYEKYSTKHPKAATVTAETLATAEPTCKNYGTMLDALATNNAKLEDSNKKMSCLMNLQNSIGQIAEKAKAPFLSLTNAAKEVYQTHSQIIDAHKKMAEKIDLEVNGKDGKGGYRDQLGKLKQMALELNNVLNAKQGDSKDGLKYGLVKQVENLKQMRVMAANKWYFTLMQDVEFCYHSEPTNCFNNDVMMAPDQCLGAMVQNETDGLRGAGRKVVGKEDLAGLQRIGLKNYISARKINLPANIDVTKPDEFLAFTSTRFQETLTGVLGAYRSHSFQLPIDKGKLTKYVGDAYHACYDKAVADFKSDMISKGGKYYGEVVGMKDAERETSNDIKNWIDRVEGQMSEFRTAFHKVYNSELGQFKSDCTAEEDPYKSLDCLRVLNATLNSGIRGTRQATKLSNGSSFVSTAGETTLPMQTLTLDAQGKPSIGSANASCSGFDDCINLMDRTQAQHSSAQQQGEDQRAKFVQQHNAAVRAAFETVSGQFANMNQLLLAGVKGVNDDLAKLGVKASIETKEVESEALEEDGKVGEDGHTGMIKMPKSMKAAIAAHKGFTEIKDTKAVTDAYNSLATELGKKAKDALAMKDKCTVTKSKYKALAGIMPNSCSSASSVCGTDRAASGVSLLEDVLRRSKNKIEDNEKSLSNNSEYNRCKSDILADARNVTTADIKKAANGVDIYSKVKDSTKKERNDEVYDSAKEDALANKREEAKQLAKQECASVIFPPLEALAGDGRDGLQEQNSNIVKLLKDVSEACSKMEPDPTTKKMPTEDSDVTDACEAFKSAANKAEPNKGEEETKSDTSVSGKDSATNPLTMPSIGAPAK